MRRRAVACRGKRQGARPGGFCDTFWRQARLHHRRAEMTQTGMFSQSVYRVRLTRGPCFAFVIGLTLVAFWAPLSMLIRFSFQQEHYSHIILVPLVSASIFFLERKRIFAHVETYWRTGLSLLFAGGLLFWFGQRLPASLSDNDHL